MRAEWFRKTAPMSPDPIKHRKYQDEAVNAVKLIFTDVATKYQHELAADTSKPSDAPTTPATKPLGCSDLSVSFLADFCNVPDIAVPTTPTVTPKAQLEEELNRYWEFEGGRGDLFDPLAWWKTNRHRYPVLPQMARDYLAIPATSVSMERTFSKSRHICTDLRSSLHTSTVTQSLLTKLWINSKHFQLIDPPERPKKRRKISEDD